VALFATLCIKAQMPEHWINDSGIEIFREDVDVFNGNYSAGIIVNTDAQADCDFINDVEIAVTAGESFKVSFWGKASPKVRMRIFFYWQGANTNYAPDYLGPASQGWEQYTYEGIVPTGATALKTGFRFYDITGFTPGEIQYLDEVIFESPLGNPLAIANGDFESWAIIKPEPSAYPTEFSGTQKGFSILTSWTDVAGDQLPDSYLILFSKEAITTTPEDGVFYPDDFGFMDGNGAANVAFGEEQFVFTRLESLTNYYFKIFPYTNSGSNIDYKTDGMAPELVLGIPDVVIIEEQDFDESWGNWEVVSISGEQQWGRDNNAGIQETPCARISGKLWGTVYENQDWLISPPMDFAPFGNAFISFYSSLGFATEELQLTLKVSTDYTGNADPLSATWTDLEPLLPDGAANWAWTWSGENDISTYESENVHLAFVYQCGTDAAATWQIDEILISGEILPASEPDQYPDNFLADADKTNIRLTWTDAAGAIAPEGYLILGSNQDNIVLPMDGFPLADDNDFSDGITALNILPGIQTAYYADLTQETNYYFKIFPYTNSGNLIDYKTNGVPPSASAFIPISLDILFTDFNNNWGGWTPFSFLGNQFWNRNNTSGLENTPCALIDGFDGQAVVNEDWLISPAIELPDTANSQVGFYSATENPGQTIQIKLSTDYDGESNPNDFMWIDFSDRVNWSPGEFSWTYSGDILLSEYPGSTVYMAFVYYSDENEAATWGIDDVRISQIPVLNEPTNYPANFAMNAEIKEITLTWQDAIGEILPSGYLVQFSDQDNSTLPENGIPVEDDLDFSDGNGIVNVLPGAEQHTFGQLADSTTYYATIIPYSNSGNFIRYKTEPLPPKDSATTAPPDGIFDFTTKHQLIIYPNPGNGLFYFEANQRIESVQVFTLSGKLVFESRISDSKGQIDLSNFEKGVYFADFKINKALTIKQHILIQ
jgi:hypothetical protein